MSGDDLRELAAEVECALGATEEDLYVYLCGIGRISRECEEHGHTVDVARVRQLVIENAERLRAAWADYRGAWASLCTELAAGAA